MRAAIVIPAYNEASTLRDVAARALVCGIPVIVVDDGSDDGSASCVEGLAVRLLRHASNQGKAAALWTGFGAAVDAGAEVVVTLDGDGQHRPEAVPDLLDAALQYPGRIVIAARLRGRTAAPRARRIANAIADFWLSWASGHRVVDSQSGQRAYPAALLRALLAEGRLRHDRRAAFTLESELLVVAARRGYRTVSLPVDTIYEPAMRPSHFRPARDIARIVAMVARHLLARGLYPGGLWRALVERPCVLAERRAIDPAATRMGLSPPRNA